MSKIWILEHTDNAGIKFYWLENRMIKSYISDISSATIYHDKQIAEDVAKSLLSCKPKVIEVNITPVK